MPAGMPPHKRADQVSSAEDRYLMALLVTAGDPHFAVSRLELDRPGPSYSIDTIRRLKAEAGEGGKVYWVIGADAALEILTWRQPDAVLDEASVVVAPRPGFDLSRLDETLGAERASKMTVIAAPLTDISSSMIRRMVRAGQSIRYLTPPAVIDYIDKRGLYRDPAGDTPAGEVES
jgi:nicotinate-nucleotide adenylyltransferase